MKDWIIVGIVLIIIGSAVAYIVKEKRKGAKCIGCPAACNCKQKGKCDSM